MKPWPRRLLIGDSVVFSENGRQRATEAQLGRLVDQFGRQLHRIDAHRIAVLDAEDETLVDVGQGGGGEPADESGPATPRRRRRQIAGPVALRPPLGRLQLPSVEIGGAGPTAHRPAAPPHAHVRLICPAPATNKIPQKQTEKSHKNNIRLGFSFLFGFPIFLDGFLCFVLEFFFRRFQRRPRSFRFRPPDGAPLVAISRTKSRASGDGRRRRRPSSHPQE